MLFLSLWDWTLETESEKLIFLKSEKHKFELDKTVDLYTKKNTH